MDLIFTVQGNYFYLRDSKAVTPKHTIDLCGERPGEDVGNLRALVSKDGELISVFSVAGLTIRHVSSCTSVLETSIQGAKADFSWDNNYVAYHARKANGSGFEIQVINIQKKLVFTVTNFVGSSYFPSWTKDNKLCFYYDGPDYRGFMLASEFLNRSGSPIPQSMSNSEEKVMLRSILPSAVPKSRIVLMTIWAPWIAHTRETLLGLSEFSRTAKRSGMDITVLAAADPNSRPVDVVRTLNDDKVHLRRVDLDWRVARKLGMDQQLPINLLFMQGRLVDRRLGGQSAAGLTTWIRSHMHDH